MDGTINIADKSSKFFSIFVNNNLIATKSFSPTLTVANLRTYLILNIPKECNFLHVLKQTPIPIEIEENINICKICDEKNNIYIESEQKKAISNNRPMEQSNKIKERRKFRYLFISF